MLQLYEEILRCFRYLETGHGMTVDGYGGMPDSFKVRKSFLVSFPALGITRSKVHLVALCVHSEPFSSSHSDTS
ncbi:hypothetical protein VTN00DRAFT_1101 [Thermoascus crustaceus]|uniref:uncharacterized protein n=1 Tax=Thermoascus crustaceus TaxID=5088 RepID=UPI003741EE56